MRHERLIGVGKAAFRGAPLLVFGLLAAAALAYAVRSHPSHPGGSIQPPFELIGHPRWHRVTAGSTARYWITIDRHSYRGRIDLILERPAQLFGSGQSSGGGGLLPGSPGAATARLTVFGRHALLTVNTSVRATPGRYTLGVRGIGGRYLAYLGLHLTILAPRVAPFSIRGSFGSLWPGLSRPVDLQLTNPNTKPIAVQSLTVAIGGIKSARANLLRSCSRTDFTVSQYAGSYPLWIPARTTTLLSALGVTSELLPQVTMLNRPVNQNGCQGATVTLNYSGVATAR